MGLPVAGSYHTELSSYALLRSGDPRVVQVVSTVLTAFYGQCRVVLSPSRSADSSLRRLGIAEERIVRWDRGVDLTRFNPARYAPDVLPHAFNVLYAGRLTREKGVEHFDDVLLVGGMTIAPAIAQTLRERFGLEARLQDPHLAVAKGAALYALMQKVKEGLTARTQARTRAPPGRWRTSSGSARSRSAA